MYETLHKQSDGIVLTHLNT